MTTMTVRRPCRRCPFLRSVPIYLRLERRRQIVHDVLVEGQEFWCHETTEWTDDENESGDYSLKGGEKICGGAARMVDQAGGSTQLMRIAERLGDDLDLDRGPAVWTAIEFQTLAMGAVGYDGERDPEAEEGETCSACEPGCLAPAGFRGVGGAVIRGVEVADGECAECGEGLCSNCADDDGLCPTCGEEAADGCV